jgi:hypothetical protein
MVSSSQTLTTTALNQTRYCGKPWVIVLILWQGGMDGATANKLVEKYGGLVAFGRHFIANVSRVFVCWWSPLSKQIAARSPCAPEGLSLMRYDRDTFCATEAAVDTLITRSRITSSLCRHHTMAPKGCAELIFQLTQVRECI